MALPTQNSNITAPTTSATSKDSEYWKATGTDFAFIKDKILNNCYKDQSELLACFLTLNTLADFMSPQGIFAMPEEVETAPKYFKKFVKNFGTIGLYESAPLDFNLSKKEIWAEIKYRQSLRAAAIPTAFALPKEQRIDFSAVVDYLQPLILKNEYSDSEALVAGAMWNTYLEASPAYGPHNFVIPVAMELEREAAANQKLNGLGIVFAQTKDKFQIQEIYTDSSAFKAGLKPGDYILAIDDTDLQNKTFNAVVELLKNLKNITCVKILRKGRIQVFTVPVGAYEIHNVEYKLINDMGLNIGYIKIRSFLANGACDETRAAIKKLQLKNAQAWVLDLRGNGGGGEEDAIGVASLFLGNKVIIKADNLKGGAYHEDFGTKDKITDLPMITLVDADSASASELIAGALQDHWRSWIAGDTTWGKGLVQHIHYLNAELLFYQVEEIYYRPSGSTVQGVGIAPDFLIDPVPEATADDKFSLHEADVYSNYILPRGLPWRNPRLAQIEKVTNCLKNQKAEQIFNQKSDEDYRLLKAEEILKCDLRPLETIH